MMTIACLNRDRGSSEITDSLDAHKPREKRAVLRATIRSHYTLSASRTRHRASTSMYSLKFRVRVTTRPQYGRKWNGASILSLARAVFAGMRSVGHCVRRAVGLADYRWALPRISSVVIATKPVHRLQIRPTVHN